MVTATAGSGINARQEKAPAITEAIPNSKPSIAINHGGVFQLPNMDTQAAFVGALLLKGYYLTPPDVIYSFMHLTRLSAVVGDLRYECGLCDRIYSDRAPLTQRQQRRRNSNHFAGYWLDADAIADLAEPAQEWADSVLAQYPIDLSKIRTARSMGKLEANNERP